MLIPTWLVDTLATLVSVFDNAVETVERLESVVDSDVETLVRLVETFARLPLIAI